MKDEFRKLVFEWYDNISSEQVEEFLEEEFIEEMTIKANLMWFGTFIQGIYD